MMDKLTAQEMKARLFAAGFIAEIDFEMDRVYVVGVEPTTLQRFLTHVGKGTNDGI